MQSPAGLDGVCRSMGALRPGAVGPSTHGGHCAVLMGATRIVVWYLLGPLLVRAVRPSCPRCLGAQRACCMPHLQWQLARRLMYVMMPLAVHCRAIYCMQINDMSALGGCKSELLCSQWTFPSKRAWVEPESLDHNFHRHLLLLAANVELQRAAQPGLRQVEQAFTTPVGMCTPPGSG
jgi:hypothetical protein